MKNKTCLFESVKEVYNMFLSKKKITNTLYGKKMYDMFIGKKSK